MEREDLNPNISIETKKKKKKKKKTTKMVWHRIVTKLNMKFQSILLNLYLVKPCHHDLKNGSEIALEKREKKVLVTLCVCQESRPWILTCVCVLEKRKKKVSASSKTTYTSWPWMVCVCVCVCKRERERERERESFQTT